MYPQQPDIGDGCLLELTVWQANVEGVLLNMSRSHKSWLDFRALHHENTCNTCMQKGCTKQSGETILQLQNELQGEPKNVPLYFCPYLRQLLTDFQIFTGTLCRQFAIM